MFKYLLLLCFAASAIQATPTYNDKNVPSTESIIETLQRIQAILERLDSSIVGEIVDLGVPLDVIATAIDTVLNIEESRDCVADVVEQIGNDIAVQLADDFEIFINLFLERAEKLEACNELPSGSVVCRARIQVTYAVRVLQAAREITDQLNEISAELQQKVISCVRSA